MKDRKYSEHHHKSGGDRCNYRLLIPPLTPTTTTTYSYNKLTLCLRHNSPYLSHHLEKAFSGIIKTAGTTPGITEAGDM
jgi:hypothetical protein